MLNKQLSQTFTLQQAVFVVKLELGDLLRELLLAGIHAIGEIHKFIFQPRK